ncbi:MAG: hypothetical protein SRB1_02861 [Desulfobacteraceae bacterium Eth-SRB1]|nr:MAG: hypothetical protein SRB1_02861 [Desulfobacteraceae bacterium Eth-SRB1]
MQIEKVNVYKILLPFKDDFSISRMQGISSNIIVVEIICDQGRVTGYGEGLPVEFITKETPATVVKDINLFTQKDYFPWDLKNVSQIWNFVDCLPDGKEHNTAVCALEMSLLDALAKRQGRSIIKYFSQDFFADRVCYGATIPLADKKRIIELCELIRKMEINRLRVKMSKDLKQNKDAIETIALMFGNDYDLRLDPNSAWNRDLAFKHIPLIKKHNIKILEEPMAKEDPDFAEFTEVIKSTGVMLMACESAASLKDVIKIVKEGCYQMINVKLSRNGGFRRTFKVIDYLRANKVAFQLGCSIGESGILSAAGRILCLLCGDAVYYDGSYDKYLLKKNITDNDVSFGPGGEAGPLDGPGLGVKINRQNLSFLSDSSKTVTIMRP